MKHLKIGTSERFSNDAVRANELPRHLHVAAGLVDEGQVEGDLPPQVHLVIWHSLRGESGRGDRDTDTPTYSSRMALNTR